MDTIEYQTDYRASWTRPRFEVGDKVQQNRGMGRGVTYTPLGTIIDRDLDTDARIVTYYVQPDNGLATWWGQDDLLPDRKD